MKEGWPVPGSQVRFERTLTGEDVEAFGRLTGDRNPLHFDAGAAREAGFSAPIVHGMLMAGLFSRLVGEELGGPHLYLAQDVIFRRPVAVGETVVVQGEVIGVHRSTGVVDLRTRIVSQGGELLVEGQARIKVVAERLPDRGDAGQ